MTASRELARICMNDANDKFDDAADPTAVVGHSDFTNALAGALANGVCIMRGY